MLHVFFPFADVFFADTNVHVDLILVAGLRIGRQR